MTSLRTLALPTLLALVLGACGGGSNKGGTGSNLMCGTPGSTGSTGSCTSAQFQPYTTCVENACDASYKGCLGPDYKAGNFTGACAPLFNCSAKCGCDDVACRSACGLPPEGCQMCLLSLASCASACTLPSCATGGGQGGTSGGGGASGGGAGSCADLLACCNAAAATFKSICMMQYTAIKPFGDAYCAMIVPSAKMSYCP